MAPHSEARQIIVEKKQVGGWQNDERVKYKEFLVCWQAYR